MCNLLFLSIKIFFYLSHPLYLLQKFSSNLFTFTSLLLKINNIIVLSLSLQIYSFALCQNYTSKFILQSEQNLNIELDQKIYIKVPAR